MTFGKLFLMKNFLNLSQLPFISYHLFEILPQIVSELGKKVVAARLFYHSCFNLSRIMVLVNGTYNSLLTSGQVLSKLGKWVASNDVMIQASFSILKVSLLFSCSGKAV